MTVSDGVSLCPRGGGVGASGSALSKSATDEADSQFKSMQRSQHCIISLLPDTRNIAYFTRKKGNHPYD